MIIAWKNLARSRARLLITAGGVGSAVLLILLVRVLYAGVLDASAAYVRAVDADLWVTEEGAPAELFDSVPLLTGTTGRDIEAVAGVVDTARLIGRAMHLPQARAAADLFVIGVDADKPWAAPADVATGSPVPGPGEIVLDAAVADGLEVGVGAILELPRGSLRISGVRRESNAMFTRLAWIHTADAEQLLQSGGLVNYYLVRVDGHAGAVADRIRSEVPGTRPLTSAEFADWNTRRIATQLLPILWMLVLIGLGVGAAVIGLTIYTSTLERRREYGVLKAIGFSNGKLLVIVWQQAILAGAIGLAVGVFATFVLAALVGRLEPVFVTSFTAGDVLFVTVAALVMTLVAAALPVRPVLRLDPVDIFRGSP